MQEWSDDPDEVPNLSCVPIETTLTTVDGILSEESTGDVKYGSDIVMQSLIKEVESRKWLMSNVQNTWWNELVIHKYPVCSKYPDAHFCQIW